MTLQKACKEKAATVTAPTTQKLILGLEINMDKRKQQKHAM